MKAEKTASLATTNSDGTESVRRTAVQIEEPAPSNMPTLVALPRTIGDPPEFRGWFLQVRFGSEVIDAQIDTRSWVSSIPLRLAKRLDCREIGDDPYDPVFEGPALNGVEVSSWNGYRVFANFDRLPTNGLDIMLLGNDFLTKFKFVGRHESMMFYLEPNPTNDC